ncbi:MAG: hypothetical protein A2987_07100 [Omnitrophica bacterium RIFCSPLOWO2_01_FULL_45_10]|nr:MAG: hypothetical protein A2987_07100 [Omnitrophica bacterium RIFCSPLOWO2_01_FULL_45_10]
MNQKCDAKRLIPRVALIGVVVLTLLLGLPQKAFAPIDAIVTRVTPTETALAAEAYLGQLIPFMRITERIK